MSITTIRILDSQVPTVRESLEAIRQEVNGDRSAGSSEARCEEVDMLLAQVGGVGGAMSFELTGSHLVLWNAVYDGLCRAAERFAADCNEIWRGETDLAVTRQQLVALGDWLTVLASLGKPPVEAL